MLFMICSVEAELGLLRSQLQRQQAVAAEQQASHADALRQLDSSRWAWAKGPNVAQLDK